MKKLMCFIFTIIFICLISLFSFASEDSIMENELINKEEEIRVAATEIEYADVPEILYVNQEFELNARVLPVDSADRIEYESSDQNICKVNSMGQIKGVKAGNAVITIKAGNVRKYINIKVDIKSVLIETNQSCVILKPGEEFHIESRVRPSDAKQHINYKTLDSNVCNVDGKGNIKAKNYGTTSVVLFNDDTSASVTVIVNNVIQNTESEVKSDIIAGKLGKEDGKNKDIKISECDIITKDVLKELYENNKKLIAEGENYTITIDGKDIVNYNNELNTDILLKCEEDKISFEIKDRLCGPITISFNEKLMKNKKYMYMYNGSKGRYEKLKFDKKLIIDNNGLYVISDNKIEKQGGNSFYICAMVTVSICIIVYYTIRKHIYFLA